MRLLNFPTKGLLLASALVLTQSCGGRDADVAFLPRAPATIAQDQAGDKRPAYPLEAATSEQSHEDWVSNTLDWGDRRNALAYRWCTLWNGYASVKVDCGPVPDGVEATPSP